MNNQEFFDKTVAHLRKQKVPCFKVHDMGTNCLYVHETPEGKVLHCAVGAHFDPALLTSPGYVGDVDTLFGEHPQIAALFEGVDRPLLRDAQLLHDSAEDGGRGGRGFTTFEGEAFEAEVKLLASKYGLAYTPPSTEGVQP